MRIGPTNPTRSEGEPHDDLTTIAGQLVDHLATIPGSDGIRIVVMLDRDGRGGIGIGGYPDDLEAVTDMFVVLAAILEANGKKMAIVPLGGDQ